MGVSQSDHLDSPDRISRRRVLAFLGSASVLVASGGVLARRLQSADTPPATPGTPAPSASPPVDPLTAFADNIRDGGPPKDGIPPIDEPRFVAADATEFLSDDDVVFGINRGGESRAYPQLVLVWHEIVNDRFQDELLTVTYCPLTGSAVAFQGSASDGQPYTFGTSGDLVNSNLLMYDRPTDSRWPQILATAITGPARGETLTEVPVVWTTWGRWRAAHPDTTVLSTETGHVRSYGSDPYGGYTPLAGYYAPESSRLFPVMHEDDRLPNKEVVVGIKHRTGRLAVRKGLVRDRGALHTELGGDPVVVLHDPDLDEGRAFLAVSAEQQVDLTPTATAGEYRDEATGTLFDAAGQPRSGPATTALPRLLSYDVMWFAWAAFFPESESLL